MVQAADPAKHTKFVMRTAEHLQTMVA